MKMGMVGCGGISHSHGKAAQRLPEVEFTACSDIDLQAAQAWADQYGCGAAYGSCAEMLEREELDAVLVATWPNKHRENVEECLEAGVLNILCEKALTLTGAEALQIWEAVTAAGAFLMEGFMYRHHPAMARAERLIAAGEIGAVDSVRACFDAYDSEAVPPDSDQRGWRQRVECGGGVPYDFACYCVNGCQHFAAGVPIRVFCRGDMSPKYGVMNRLYGLIEYDNGCVGTVESSRRSCLSQELQVAGGQGILSLPLAWTIFEDSEVRIKRAPGWDRDLGDRFQIAKADPYELQLRNFAAAVAGAERPAVPLAESVINTYAIEALVTSAAEQAPVEVGVPEDIRQAMDEERESAAAAAGHHR